jgi:hypothetical protein
MAQIPGQAPAGSEKAMPELLTRLAPSMFHRSQLSSSQRKRGAVLTKVRKGGEPRQVQ